MQENSSSKAVITAALITGVFGLIGVVCAALITIYPDLLGKVPQPTYTALPTEPSATAIPASATPSPTNTPLPPTDTPTPTVTPGLPEGYLLVDDFSQASNLTENWQVGDPKKICSLAVREGNLYFDCQNKTKDDLEASLLPLMQPERFSGAAAFVTVTEAGGPLQLTTGWKCADEPTERAYHLSSGTNQAQAIEFYPLEDWRARLLGEMSVAVGVPHLLQIEASEEGVVFLVDGKQMPLLASPDFPACLELDNWGFSFFVWKDNNNLKGQIDFVGIKP